MIAAPHSWRATVRRLPWPGFGMRDSQASLVKTDTSFCLGSGADLPKAYEALRLKRLRARHPKLDTERKRAIELASQAAQAVLQTEPYDVQRDAALVMAAGNVAEMATGEGKTLAVALAAVAIAVSGEGVHIATANDYLAHRDFTLFGKLYRYLGLSVGVCQSQQTDTQRSATYGNDIVYGTANHFAFDNLRAALQTRTRLQRPLGEQKDIQRGLLDEGPPRRLRRHSAVLVDEIDHILIDEADTPLILSVPQPHIRPVPATVYATAQSMVGRLLPERDWQLDRERSKVVLTDRGRAAALRQQPHVPLARPWTEYAERAIEARFVRQRDIDYVVRHQKVELIDHATGRIGVGRQWQDGLHQAVEQEESLQLTEEYAAAAQITRRQFFQRYRMVAGCSGTAWDCRKELRSLYGLETIRIPLRRPSALQIAEPHFSASKADKLQALLTEIQTVHRTGRPVLIGMRTIQDSQELADRIGDLGLSCRLLNGHQTADEADVIAQAGRHGAITVATDLAGRGTDIQLTKESRELGGLHVILAEPRHSRRLDRQLIGRAARQGEPGSARVFVSGEDKLIVQYAPALAGLLSKKRRASKGIRVLWGAVLRAAKRCEAHRAEIRRLIASRQQSHDQFFSTVHLHDR